MFYFYATVFLIFFLAVLINFVFDSAWIGTIIGAGALIIYLFIVIKKYISLSKEGKP